MTLVTTEDFPDLNLRVDDQAGPPLELGLAPRYRQEPWNFAATQWNERVPGPFAHLGRELSRGP